MASRQTRNVLHYMKIRRGGEAFWVRVVGEDAGQKVVRVENMTTDPDAPRYGTEIAIPDDEEILDSMRSAPMLYSVG